MTEGSRLKERSKAYSVFTVLVGALLMGFLWSVRGTHGWGSSWGLLNAGFIYTVFIICINGGRKKLGLGWLSITAISFMLTTPAWGTLLKQICGYISFGFNDTEVVAADVSAFSAIFIMLCMGFGLAALYGILLGRAYSDVKWKWWHFVVLIAVFYAVDLISKAFLSHWILDIVQPQAKDVFAQGLEMAEKSGSVWKNYMEHFANDSWAKKIYGGRNYFASVQAIASALRAAAVLIAVRFIIKDKRSANVGFAVCGSFALAITVSDLFFFFSEGGWHGEQGFSLPENMAAWGTWEYMTGFIAGLIITIVMLKLKARDDVDDFFVDDVPSTLKELFTFIVGNVVLIGINMVRPVAERFDDSMNQIVYAVIAAVFALALIIFISSKCGINASKVDMRYYSALMLMITVFCVFVMFMFVGTSNYAEIHEVNSFPNIFNVISFVLVMAWSIVNYIKTKELKN